MACIYKIEHSCRSKHSVCQYGKYFDYYISKDNSDKAMSDIYENLLKGKDIRPFYYYPYRECEFKNVIFHPDDNGASTSDIYADVYVNGRCEYCIHIMRSKVETRD